MEAKKSADAFKLGMVSDASAKGQAGLIGGVGQPNIVVNPPQSQVFVSSEDRLQDLTSGDPLKKRISFNGAELNSSEKQGIDVYQQMDGDSVLRGGQDGKQDDSER